jgi:hypothetical protein
METKVISTKVDKDFFDRVNAVANRLYPKSYNNQPNCTQLIMDALNLFCALAEAGSLDGINLSQIDTEHLIYLVNNSREDTLRQIFSSLERIEDKLNDTTTNSIKKKQPNKNQKKKLKTNTVNSVNEDSETTIFSLQEAWEIASKNGFPSNKESFRKRFDRKADHPNFVLCSFKRIPNPEGRGYFYQLQK